MLPIILCGDKNDSGINSTMFNALSNYGEILKHGRTRFNETPEKNNLSFLIYECEHIPEMNEPFGILVFKNSFKYQNDNYIPKTFTPILDFQNKSAISVLKGSDNIAITCGTSPKATLSIASLDLSGAVVSLQRDIKAISSKIIEPHDFRIKTKGDIGVYPLLAVCAVLLISGISSESGYYF